MCIAIASLFSRQARLRSSGILPLLLLAAASTAHAGDGVVEINQTCAVVTGCNVNDNEGFPVSFNYQNAPSSFVLTSDLVVADVATGTRIENMSIESNGGNGISAYGAEALHVSQSRIVRNGADGIATAAGQPRGSLITNNAIVANAGEGIEGTGFMAIGNMIEGNGGYALKANAGSLVAPYGQNGFYDNNGGSANVQVIGGQSLGGNYCGDTSC